MEDYYKVTHILRFDYGYQGDTIDSMLPWELSIELSMIIQSLQKEIAKHNRIK